MSVPDGVAFEAVTLYLARDRGELADGALVDALSSIVGEVETQADAFDLLTRVAGLAANAVTGWADQLGIPPEALLRKAAVGHAGREERQLDPLD